MRLALHVISIALFALLSLFLILFGAFYATVDDILFFHAAAVPEAAQNAVRPLYFALMKLVRGASGALGVLGLYVTFVPLLKRARFAGAMLAIAYAIAFVAAAVTAEQLASQTGAPTSWHIMGVLLGITAIACTASAAASGAPKQP